MLNQTILKLSSLDLVSFRNEGVIQSQFDSDIVWLGYGEQANGEITFFDSNFFNNQQSSYTPNFIIKTNISELIGFLSKYSIKYPLDIMQNLDELYAQDVEKIQDWIKSGEIEKMVAVTSEIYRRPSDFDPLSILSNLISKLNGSVYGRWDNNYGIIGISPEPLFVCSEKQCFTYALAGTISNEVNSYKEILLNDPKELLEHNLVIEDLKKKLCSFSSNIKVLDTQTIDFGKISHLKTCIDFSLTSKVNPLDMVSSLSPSAALGGFPANIVNKFYDKTHHYQQMQNSRVFGGSIGFKYNNFTQAVVMIRNLQWDQNKLWIESGSGIVGQSILKNELNEVKRKRDSIKKVLFK